MVEAFTLRATDVYTLGVYLKEWRMARTFMQKLEVLSA